MEKQDLLHVGYVPKGEDSKVHEEDLDWTMLQSNDCLMEYTVKKSDSMLKISFLSGMSEKQIQQLNNLTSSTLVPG